MEGLLVDNDAFVLLAGADLLADARVLLSAPAESTFYLTSLPHMLRGRRLKGAYAPEALHRAARQCDKFAACPHIPDPDLLQSLIDVPNIDGGEAQLLATLAEVPGYALLTGDKRAVMAVATDPALSATRNRIAGRVVCFESLLSRLVVSKGVQAIGEAFKLFSDNKTLQIHLSSAKLQNQHYCLQSIASYVRDLKAQVGSDFLYEP